MGPQKFFLGGVIENCYDQKSACHGRGNERCHQSHGKDEQKYEATSDSKNYARFEKNPKILTHFGHFRI